MHAGVTHKLYFEKWQLNVLWTKGDPLTSRDIYHAINISGNQKLILNSSPECQFLIFAHDPWPGRAVFYEVELPHLPVFTEVARPQPTRPSYDPGYGITYRIQPRPSVVFLGLVFLGFFPEVNPTLLPRDAWRLTPGVTHKLYAAIFPGNI